MERYHTAKNSRIHPGTSPCGRFGIHVTDSLWFAGMLMLTGPASRNRATALPGHTIRHRLPRLLLPQENARALAAYRERVSDFLRRAGRYFQRMEIAYVTSSILSRAFWAGSRIASGTLILYVSLSRQCRTLLSVVFFMFGHTMSFLRG